MPEALAAIDSLDLPGVGVACYNDDVATTLLSAATLRGWAVPQDVGLVGMDNTPLSAVSVPPLTTVGYDLKAVAYNLITAALSGIGEQVTDRELADAHFALTERSSS
jgi:DNA-binding LacI/PurR family transcriptional regulator